MLLQIVDSHTQKGIFGWRRENESTREWRIETDKPTGCHNWLAEEASADLGALVASITAISESMTSH